MTDAQKAYINHYCTNFSRTGAYRHAHPGVTQSTAESEGSKLARDPRVSQEIRRRLAEIAKASRYSAKRTLDQIAFVAFSDVADFFDANGCLIPLNDLPRHATAALKNFKFEEIRRASGDGTTKLISRTITVELADSVAALRLLAQHLGLVK